VGRSQTSLYMSGSATSAVKLIMGVVTIFFPQVLIM
jgi:hypothetical protein